MGLVCANRRMGLWGCQGIGCMGIGGWYGLGERFFDLNVEHFLQLDWFLLIFPTLNREIT